MTLHMTDIEVTPEQVARIPRIVDVDAHIVEPPHVWSSRLPAKYRDVGPRIEYHPFGTPKLDGARYIEAPGTEGPDVAWWIYEDYLFSLKRIIAASGFPPEEVTMRGVTYEEMRPGCWSVPDRISDMDVNHVEAQLCYPNYPRFAGQIFLWGKDRTLAELCVRAYNDWMVEEWCGESGGRLIPLCLVPLWDVELAAAEIRRNAARGVRAVAFTELPGLPRPPEHPLRLLGPVLRRVRGDLDRPVHAHRLGHQDPADVGGRARSGTGHDHLGEQRGQPHRLPVLRACSTATRACG